MSDQLASITEQDLGMVASNRFFTPVRYDWVMTADHGEPSPQGEDAHERDEGGECVFCAIVAGRCEALKLIDDGEVVAFLDHNPINAGHTLVIPKRHVAEFTALATRELLAVFVTAQQIARGLVEVLGAEGVNFMINQGSIAGQRVFHVHCHVLPRYRKDGLVFKRVEKVEPLEGLMPVHRRLTRYCTEHPVDD